MRNKISLVPFAMVGIISLIGILFLPVSVVFTVCLLMFLALFLRFYGLFSSPFLLTLFLFFPALNPVYATVVRGGELYSYLNPYLQYDVALTERALRLVYIALLAYVLALVLATASIAVTSYRSDFSQWNKHSGYFSSKSGYFGACLMFILFAYITEPGPTLLSNSYTDILNRRISNTQFASALFLLFWLAAFLHAQNMERSRLFQLGTVFSILWLLLHAKRSPVVGVVFVLCIVFVGAKRLHKILNGRSIAAGIGALAILAVLVLIGDLRSRPLITIGIQDVVTSLTFVDDTNIHALPGGSANVFVTMLGSLFMVERLGLPLLLGRTYVSYLYNLLPSNVLVVFGLPLPEFYFTIYEKYFVYNGGTFPFAEAYANFGTMGVGLLGGLIGYLVGLAHKHVFSQSYFKRLIALVIIAFFPVATWYGMQQLFKPLVYSCIFFIGLLLIRRRLHVY